MIQHMKPIGEGNSRQLELADGASDGPIAQVVARIGVEADDQQTRMMAAESHDQVVQIFEVLGISGQHGQRLADRPDQHPGIRGRKQPDVMGKDRTVALGLEPRGETPIARILVEQEPLREVRVP
jgi:hypothetical protein